MGQDPEVIRQEIEETRSRMTETVDALGYKADVKSRTQEKVSDKVSSVKEKVADVKDSVVGSASSAKDSVTGSASSARGSVSGGASSVTGRISDATPSAGEVKAKAKRGASVAQENPLGLAIGATALGFLAGLLIPTTRVEEEKLAPVAVQAREKVVETGQEALERGKSVAQDVASTVQEHGQQAVQEAKETAKQSGQQQAQGLKDTAQSNASDVQQTTQSRVS